MIWSDGEIVSPENHEGCTMPQIVLTEAEKAVEQTYVDAAEAHGCVFADASIPQSVLEARANELTKEQVPPDKVQELLQAMVDAKWVKSASDPELGAYEDHYQLARAYCRKYSLKGYPEHLDKDAQWKRDQVDTVGLDLAAIKAEQDASPAA